MGYTATDVSFLSNGLVNLQMNFKQHESLFKNGPHDTVQTLTSSSFLSELLSLETR
jgi:hypothetical protein